MSNEKHNNRLNWQDKLDQLDHLPGEQESNKAAAWNKLHKRLQDEPTTQNGRWYWIAAACVVVALGASWLMLARTENRSVKESEQLKPKTQSPPQAVRETINDAPLIVNGVNQQIGPIHKKIKKSPVIINETLAFEKPVQTKIDITKEPKLESLTNFIQPPDSGFIAAPAKKTLRVVHINELDKPFIKEIQFVRNSTRGPLPSNLFGQDVYDGSSSTNSPSDNILKIKLSPSN